jgi:hypothetical protein
MLHLPISKPARERLAYAAMSLLIVWHTTAMVIESAPDSIATPAVPPPLQPYMTLFGMENNWGFFAPNVHAGTQFRYVIEDAAGKHHSFAPGEQLSRFSPTSIWFKDRYKSIMDYPDAYGDAVAASLCQEHAALRPVAITLLRVEQKGYWPEDRLAGKQLLDPELIDVENLKTVQCPAR